jgi:hypothetical protein
MRASNLVLAALLAWPAMAGSFQDVVSNVETRMGARRMRMPGLGMLVNSFTFVRRPGGATSMKLAVFEDQHFAPARFQSAVQEAAGRDWKPMIQVNSKGARESMTAYVRTSGNSFEMLIATCDSDDATLVQLKLDGHRLSNWLRDQTEKGSRHKESEIQ